MHSGPVAILAQASGSAFPILTGFNMSVNGLSVALREFGISDDSGLKLREAGLDDLDLIAAAFDDVQDFTSWLEVQPSVPLKCFFERCQASAKASVLSCAAQVSLPTPEVSVPVDTSSSALSSPVPVELKLTGDGTRQDVVPRTIRKRGFERGGRGRLRGLARSRPLLR